ncbi:Spore protein SP21 [Maioricimonas rarisocia]|uniref:Spore protein SP21 n=1 Tax=Maioricimonas rarisocia TaxID=2528026 RepID=A0A517Z8L1_9PLAN|nr:Hsp20/alpha crystallin family protein [Maioricimonas rarisocia]QDU38804.1 Spore protein SP21 [Maioricimonas rarisocia]
MNTTKNEVARTEGHEASVNSWSTVRPHVDIVETDDAFHLHVEMPGVNEERIEVELEQDLLTLRGTAERSGPDGYRLVYGDRRGRRFERTFRLPDEVNREQIEASVRDGVLTVTLGKVAEAVPKRIAVKRG